MSEYNAMLDGTLGAGSGLLGLVLLGVVLAINAAADSKRREMARRPEHQAAMQDTAFRANYQANGCIGWALGIGAIVAAAMILGGMAIGG